jgi:hypothetical protein
MNATLRIVPALNALVNQPPPPPLGLKPERYGSGRIELQIYPGATLDDRIRAARTLLAGTPYEVTPKLETLTP